jgi:hypothetical protein
VEREGSAHPDLPDLVHLAAALRVSLLAFALAALFHPVGYEFYFYYLGGLAVGAHHIFQRAVALTTARLTEARTPTTAAGPALSVAGGGVSA